ncbi:cation transporter [Xanthomonas citri pv. mangiferaeindicae]|nr:cation transporter [Xanthomonas citri pv. mangiferaeindicae]
MSRAGPACSEQFSWLRVRANQVRFYPLDDGLLNRIQHELAARKRDEPEHP